MVHLEQMGYAWMLGPGHHARKLLGTHIHTVTPVLMQGAEQMIL